jgi:DNA (cytosine-5)-methyltransferase 1
MTNVSLPKRLRELHLFAGCGGGILGGILLGHHPVCAVEIEPYCRKVLLQRQRDGVLPRFPVWDDVRTFDGKPWRGQVDVVCGGFPCTDICVASAVHGKRAGITGERSGLWGEMARIAAEIRPRYIFIENSGSLVSFGLGAVLRDLAEMGYDARWGVLGAHHLGAPHGRSKTWIVADSGGFGMERLWNGEDAGEYRPWGQACQADLFSHDPFERNPVFGESMLLRVADGVDRGVDRLKAIGNGQVPAVAAMAWRILSNRIAQ